MAGIGPNLSLRSALLVTLASSRPGPCRPRPRRGCARRRGCGRRREKAGGLRPNLALLANFWGFLGAVITSYKGSEEKPRHWKPYGKLKNRRIRRFRWPPTCFFLAKWTCHQRPTPQLGGRGVAKGCGVIIPLLAHKKRESWQCRLQYVALLKRQSGLVRGPSLTFTTGK